MTPAGEGSPHLGDLGRGEGRNHPPARPGTGPLQSLPLVAFDYKVRMTRGLSPWIPVIDTSPAAGNTAARRGQEGGRIGTTLEKPGSVWGKTFISELDSDLNLATCRWHETLLSG
jgi:hypothetical protein